ncbi:MAG TPA: DAHL domain-containing protein [Casimicrobiaceae bacterium]|nr:DAHL domain-containing protein [Casimicrobiaceae bacterium]
MSTRITRLVPSAVAAVVLIGVLAALYAKSSAVDVEKRSRVEGYVRQLKQVDAEWNVDVLKSRMGINANYDPLVSPLPKLRTLRAKLAHELAGVTDPEIAPALAAVGATIDHKTDLIERFKSENAILRNSLRYAPTAVSELDARIDAATRADPARAALLNALGNRADETLTGILRYNLFPDRSTAATLATEVATLVPLAAGVGDDVGDSLTNFVRHAQVILAQREVGDAVLGNILAAPIDADADRLGSAFDRDFTVSLEKSNRYRHLLLAYASLLLALLAYVGYRLVRSFRVIARVNHELKDANESLERRVHQRTEELSRALDDLKESESQLVQNEKMASLGQMVAGVAHEINTPLAYVRSSLETVQTHFDGFVREFVGAMTRLVDLMRSPETPDTEISDQFETAVAIRDRLDEIPVADEIASLLKDGVHGVDEISGIVVNLKDFSRRDRSQMSRCAIEDCLASTLQIAKPVLAGRHLRRLFAPTTPIQCAPSRINQIFLNLITNAAQATGEEGLITLVTRMADAQHVVVEVMDNGSGIPDDVLPKIFDPFFTTKSVGEGTGLGLSIVYKIVEQHGGSIRVHSRPGVGTKFTVVFPVASGESSALDSQPVPEIDIAA